MKTPRLKEWREARGETQVTLAERSGVAEHTISRIEHGAFLRPSTARKLADALNVSVADLMEKPSVPLGEPVPLAEAPYTGPTPQGPVAPQGWSFTPNLDILSRNMETFSSEELHEAIRQLSADLKANRTYESALAETREETVMRARNLAAIHVLGEELRRRGDEPPENWLPAYRRWKQIIMTPPPEATEDSAEDHRASEAG